MAKHNMMGAQLITSLNVAFSKGEDNTTIRHDRHFRKAYSYAGIMKHMDQSSVWQMRMEVIISAKCVTCKWKEIFEHMLIIYF